MGPPVIGVSTATHTLGEPFQYHTLGGMQIVFPFHSLFGITDTKVSLFTLSNLKGKSGEKINIIKSVAPVWSQFALHLDFDPDGTTIQTIEKKCRPDPTACCEEMMRLWLKGMGSRQPVTWKLIVEILSDTELKVLAKQVEEVTCMCV